MPASRQWWKGRSKALAAIVILSEAKNLSEAKAHNMKHISLLIALCAVSWAQDVVPVPTLEAQSDSIAYDVAPWPIEGKCPLPKYPKLGGMAGVPGRVNVVLSIDSLGRVVRHTLNLERPELLGFAPAVEEACTSWIFSPAIYKGQPIEMEMSLTFQFRMRDCRDYESEYSCIETERQAYVDSVQALRNRNPRQVYSPPPVVEASHYVELNTNGNH